MPTTTVVTVHPGGYASDSVAVRDGDGFTSSSSTRTNKTASTKTVSKTWSRTPNYVALKEVGELPQNDYSYSMVHAYEQTGSFSYSSYSAPWTNSISGGGILQNGVLPPSDVAPSVAAAVDDLAITQLLGNIKDMKTNVAQMIAERKQTMSLVVTTAIRFARMFTALKRGDIRGAADSVGASYSRKNRKRYHTSVRADPHGTAAKAWLELQYGWKPLLQDCFGSAEMIAKIHSGDLSSVAEGKCVRPINETSISGPLWDRLTEHSDVRYTVKYKLHYGTPNINLSLAGQLGLTNPALLAWELLPYSFVVDWFLPIGNWINTLDATVGLEFISGTRVTHLAGSRKSTLVHSKDPSSPLSVKTDMAQWSKKTVTVKIVRSRLTSFPRAGFPRFKSPLSPIHAGNALALLVCVFRR